KLDVSKPTKWATARGLPSVSRAGRLFGDETQGSTFGYTLGYMPKPASRPEGEPFKTASQTRASSAITRSCKTGAYSNCSGRINTLRNTVIIGASQTRSG